ncbi:alpha/beta fold hydrolase [Dyella jiangningensis]|uniref:alpha/beta hydrolase n=1 Tax=Dyella jiangningensis TaxID=1379159 RepID=UPI002410409B|nr:alpha/beta fold hydrolase [Dyella jiangningensis]MDG2537413.1 alpha/beta fold hydrolase [Dyella jiangningensis]
MIQNVEFRFEGGRSGVLLIHGLTGTPAEMRLVGKGLNRAGFSVYGMQLAGHCGDAKDLLATNWQDWYASVVKAAEQFRQDVDHLFVAGLSMGAVLALKLAADHPDWVKGVGVYGATFKYDGWATPWYGKFSFLLPLIDSLGIGRNWMVHEEEPYGLRDERLRQQISSLMLGGDSAAAGLPGNPWPSLAEMYKMAAVVRRDLPKVNAPCLIAHATEDDIASIQNAYLVERSVSGPVETLWLEDSYHMITIDRERRVLIDRSAAFFQQVAATYEPAARAAA